MRNKRKNDADWVQSANYLWPNAIALTNQARLVKPTPKSSIHPFYTPYPSPFSPPPNTLYFPTSYYLHYTTPAAYPHTFLTTAT